MGGTNDKKNPAQDKPNDKNPQSAAGANPAEEQQEQESTQVEEAETKPQESSGQEPKTVKVESASEEHEQEQETKKAAKPKNPGARWYVVHTYSGHESKVAATLKQRIDSQKLSDKIFDILVPTQEKIEIREGKKNTVKEKIFPGYLLVNMVLDDTTWLAVRTTPGITGFIGTSNKPTPLPEEEVETIKRFMSLEAPKFKAAFSIGEAVKITDGPFSEFLGTISEIDDERGKLKILVSIFGRETPVELDFLQVAKL